MRKVVLLFTMLMAFSVCVFAQTKTITGHVYDEAGNAVPFASITEKGTNNGTAADASGDFTITVKQNAILVISATGFIDQEVTPTGSTVVVNLKSQGRTIEEVIVTAGGIKTKKKDVGTAATLITGQTLIKGKAMNIANGLQGKVAGLMINATGGGVNPNYRMILRGQRSLTGNNQALLVLDNVIVPNDVLGNLNPNDVDDITVLNGAGAAALYGSQASNGAVIVTTKKGRNGQTAVTFAHTTTLENVAFYPKNQKLFGAGGSSYGYDDNGKVTWSYIENQSYGDAFDGSLRPLGAPLEDGRQDSAYYSYTDGWKKFWKTGLSNQEDISLTTGDDKSTLYFSGQFANITGTTPGDKYNRTTLRVNGTRKIGNTILLTYSTGYVQNRYDITTQTGSMYGNMLNMPQNVDITKYANWRTDPFASPIGYYNPWYQNPYFSADNYRSKTRNDYLTGNVEIKFTPIKGLDFVARQGLATRNYSNKNTVAEYLYSEYSKHTDASQKADIPGSVSDGSGYTTQLISDLFAQYNNTKLTEDFSLRALGGVQIRQDESKGVGVSGNGLVVPNLFNVSNGVGTPGASESNYKARQVGLYAEARIGYKDFLFLHGTARQDAVSILDPENNKFFYPSFDVSFVASDAIEAIKNTNVISYLKLRAGWAKTGQVNLRGRPYGAYSTLPTYGQAYGYPYETSAGFTIGNQLVSAGLKPEITTGPEFGFDLNLLKDRITSSFTYYNTRTKDQTISTGVAASSGFTSLLTNVGETQSRGVEIAAHFTPVRNADWDITFGGNYTYLDNKVISITADLPSLSLATYGNGAGSYAIEGMPFPVIQGFDYVRDDEGRVIVDAITGLPKRTDAIKVLGSAVNRHRIGLDASVSWRNLSFSALMEYRGGALIYNNMGAELDWSGTGSRTATYNRDRFVFPNSVYWDEATNSYVRNTNITVKDGNGNAGFWTDGVNRDVSSNYVTSADFWKLREMAISYDLPDNLLGDRRIVKGVRISVQGRNLFVWLPKDNLYTDPEYSDAGADSNGIGLTGISQTPPSRFYGATLTVKF